MIEVINLSCYALFLSVIIHNRGSLFSQSVMIDNLN